MQTIETMERMVKLMQSLRAMALFAGFLVALGHIGPLPAFAVDRDKLLTDTGVYGTFVALRIDSDWWKLDKAAREAGAASLREAFGGSDDRVAADVYLLRGLSDAADLMVRVHATELRHNQDFLVSLLASGAGKYFKVVAAFNGLTKPVNYVPRFADDVKAGLKVPLDPGPKPYAVVIPIRKDAEWWNLDQQARTALMEEHTKASLPYLKTVKRKLYHATGLDGYDFVTYFETARLEDFNNLIIALHSVKENLHNRRVGPVLLGTAQSIDQVASMLGR